MSRLRKLSSGTMKPALPLFVLAVLTACTTPPVPAREATRVTYACDQGPAVVVDYVRDFARLPRGGDPPIKLRQRQDSSGVWYESITYTIRPRGNDITIAVGREAPRTCTPTQTELL